MFEKLTQLAGQTATRASRRQFLDRVGRGAMTLAAVMAGLLAIPGEAQAATACGAASDTFCRGLVEGAGCFIGTTAGICRGSPACRCTPVQGPRGGRPPRPRRPR